MPTSSSTSSASVPPCGASTRHEREVRLAWADRLPAPAARPAQWPLRVQRGGAAPRATLLHGDSLASLDALLAERGEGCVDLVYLDPPFGTGDRHRRRRTVSGADGELVVDLLAYDDAQPLADWLEGMAAVLERCHRLLRRSGSLYLHVDWRRGPYVRLLLDEIFGPDALRNEIIWSYGLGGSARDRFARKHDVIYAYARDPQAVWFAPVWEHATSQRLRGQRKLATDVWRTRDADPATPIDGDWSQAPWTDTLFDLTLSNRDPQRTGYPTQKPQALGDRICAASLPPGGVALEPMCGSATVGVAALRRGGEALLLDRGLVALDTARGRVEALGLPWELALAEVREVAPIALLRDAGGLLRLGDGPGPAVAADAPATLASLMARDGRLGLSAWGLASRQGDALVLRRWVDGGPLAALDDGNAPGRIALDHPDGSDCDGRGDDWVVRVDLAGGWSIARRLPSEAEYVG